MKYRRLGNGGIKVSEIAIGGWLTFGGALDQKTTERIIDTAIDRGVNFIDLADIYSQGKAEEACGKAIKDYDRSNLVISSKLFWRMSDDPNDRGLSRKHIFESIDKSLKRLGTDYLDIYLCHRFDPETEVEEVVRAMDDLIRQGKILYWGTSVWESPQIEKAATVAEKYLCYRPQVEQPRYNMIDRHIELSVMPTCARLGMGLVVWSPLAQGILTGKYNDGVPAGSRGTTDEWVQGELTEDNIRRTRRLTALASELGITMSQLALAWVLRRREVSCAITGATAPEQIEMNAVASEVELIPATLKMIDKILDEGKGTTS